MPYTESFWPFAIGQDSAKSSRFSRLKMLRSKGNMKSIAQLETLYFKLRHGFVNGVVCAACVDWAVERLDLDEEGDDLEIILLASARGLDEVLPLVEVIVERYLGSERLDDQLAAGKYIVELRNAYLQGKETIWTIDMKLTQLYSKLGYPNWLGMLSRNCEYATDVSAFEEPFELEFHYISTLWGSVSSRAEFEQHYCAEISQGHDVK
ncbi:hypothetical protein [Janthinobacterium sp. 13]|uniref:hypothetical protein n=1 Tax=Janthinobacterium sp. 13 TaxID=2035211 RepID=UPI000C667D98|nr:hypothetical protein [Janthinobacterium sp. 13]PIF13401.1 hypothetical protein CLU94_5511 [Janthinobacterium sp. 13]